MNIVQLTPGAGGMYCGNCFRDNALVAEWRKMGHNAVMASLYLPMTLDEEDQSRGAPVFFAGTNVYLEQIFPLFGKAPDWLRSWLASPALLKWAGGRAAKTRADQLGDLTLSMINGELGNQARDLDDLVSWLKNDQKPDVVCLSNALLIGMARRIRNDVGAPVAVHLQGEDSFLDSLPESHRGKCWSALRERAAEVDTFIAPSHYFAELMTKRLDLRPERVKVVYNGIRLDGYERAPIDLNPPVLGYFARMCKEKGLDTLVAAYIHLRAKNLVPNLRLKVGGAMGPSDEPFVAKLKEDLRASGLLGDVEFHPNVEKSAKQAFMKTLSVLSVPALYGEAFGLYLVEAWAAGVPVVQPRHAAFPELVQASGGGVICEARDPVALAEAIASVTNSLDHRRRLSDAAFNASRSTFNVAAMASAMLRELPTSRNTP
jgi:glycosyltransferase involved in cell wall biosynthesis